MQFVKILVGEKDGGDFCTMILPEFVRDRDSGVTLDVLQCVPSTLNGACSMIRINDPQRVLADKIGERTQFVSDMGECMIDRISPTQLIAMVFNNNCHASKIITQNGCFVTSAMNRPDGKVEMTLMGKDSKTLHSLIDRMREENFDIEKQSSTSFTYRSLLTVEQERVMKMAVDFGYYDIPRKISMTELSEVAGCSKSNLDAILRKAESKIIRYYFSENPRGFEKQ